MWVNSMSTEFVTNVERLTYKDDDSKEMAKSKKSLDSGGNEKNRLFFIFALFYLFVFGKY